MLKKFTTEIRTTSQEVNELINYPVHVNMFSSLTLVSELISCKICGVFCEFIVCFAQEICVLYKMMNLFILDHNYVIETYLYLAF